MFLLRSSVIVALVFPATALADSWNPWCDQRIVSPNGEYYVVVKRTGGPRFSGEWGVLEYVIAKRGPGTPPVAPAQSTTVESEIHSKDRRPLYEVRPHPQVCVRVGDQTLGRGQLERPPLKVIVSNDGLGFVGLDVYGYNYGHTDAGLRLPHAVIVVSSNGEVLHRKRLVDLFTDRELDRFETSAGGMWWLGHPIAGWLHDSAEQIVIVSSGDYQSAGHLIRFVDWRTGKVTRGPDQKSREDILRFKREHLRSNR